MRLLNFVQQHDTIRLPSDPFAKLSSFLVSDISRRRADESRNGEFLHVFAHVDSYHIILGIKQILGDTLGQFRLADTGRPEEHERPDRPARILEPGPVSLDCPHDGVDGIVLAYDASSQALAHFHYPVSLGLGDLVYRDAGHFRDDGRDVIFFDDALLFSRASFQPDH